MIYQHKLLLFYLPMIVKVLFHGIFGGLLAIIVLLVIYKFEKEVANMLNIDNLLRKIKNIYYPKKVQ